MIACSERALVLNAGSPGSRSKVALLTEKSGLVMVSVTKRAYPEGIEPFSFGDAELTAREEGGKLTLKYFEPSQFFGYGVSYEAANCFAFAALLVLRSYSLPGDLNRRLFVLVTSFFSSFGVLRSSGECRSLLVAFLLLYLQWAGFGTPLSLLSRETGLQNYAEQCAASVLSFPTGVPAAARSSGKEVFSFFKEKIPLYGHCLELFDTLNLTLGT